MKVYWILIFMLPLVLMGQDMNSDLKADLIFYGDVMINADVPANRERAAKSFDQIIEKFISESTASNIDLSFVRQLSKVVSEDSLITIYTWGVELEDSKYDYEGYVFYNGKSHHKLVNRSAFDSNIRYATHTSQDWYGARYYNIVKFSDGEYLLFGRNDNGGFNNAKVVDVLSYEGDNLVLGKEIFQDPEDTLTYNNKIYITYSEDASVNLNYNAGMEMIVQDHLIQRIGRMPGQGPTYLPDGTYSGYGYRDGKWMFKEKLFDHSYGENNAPRPKPILNTKRKTKPKSSSKSRR